MIDPGDIITFVKPGHAVASSTVNKVENQGDSATTGDSAAVDSVRFSCFADISPDLTHAFCLRFNVSAKLLNLSTSLS